MNAKKNRILQPALILLFILLAAFLPAQNTNISGDSTINQCETKTYTISVLNNSGSPLTAMIVTAKLGNLTGFSYVSSTASINVNGGGAFCTMNPNLSGTDLIWDIDAVCPGSPFTLANGETLNVAFDLATDCAAVSGSLNVRVDYEIGGTPMFDETGALSIQVLPGGVTIKKTPNVIPQEIGQDVTWTLTVENTGFGTIKNVLVTDVLGAGLGYVSSTPVGVNAGQTTTWGASEIPGFASMNPGEKITIDVTATVVACENLENNADARWGCDLVSDCYNTADTIPPSTATASVERIVKTPLIQYAPPDVTFTYCEDYADVSFTITNSGDGRAHDVWISVDFGSLTVSNVSAGAIYNNVDKRFELTNPLTAAPGPGNTYDLSFRLNYSAWCGTSFPSGNLIWQTVYKDDCDNDFFPPVQLSTLNSPAGVPSLSVGKTGAPAAVQIGSQITYVITSAYSGPLSCGSGTTSPVTITDTLPAGFTIIDPAGGDTSIPGTIRWTYDPALDPPFSETIILQVPDRTQCETYCFTTFTNTIQASATDCCGCPLSASASQTTAIECEELVDSEKTAVPATGIRCDTIEYTNTYAFVDDPNLDEVNLSELIFREDADNEQEFVPGSLAVTLNGIGDITACALAGLTDTTPGAGGNITINFSNCSMIYAIRGRTLTITYRLTITEDTVGACSGATFYSWSQLDMNFASGSECLPDGIIYETTTVSVDPPAMSLAISGLGQIIDKCQTQTITMTLTQTSGTATPKDVRLVLSGLNYYVVNPAATVCSGDVAPTSCTPTMSGDDYVWYFADGFSASGQQVVIELDVQKRCSGGGDLSATAYFDDNCNDDGTYDDTCSVNATETPVLLLNGDLLIEKNPEVYYATTNTVEWKIYVTNRGSGSAYNVWLDDVLGAGLDYVSAVVSDMTGVTVTADQDHLGAPINGCTIAIAEMTAGQRREITFRALLIDCNNLTNNVSSSWGCGGMACQTMVSDSSTVAIPRPLLLNTNVVTTPAEACSSPGGAITLKNAGQTTCYNLQITETLPAGLTYVSGTTQWRLNGGTWNGPNAAYDPSPTTSPLQWTKTEIAGLSTVNPGDVLEVEYKLAAECPFNGGNITLSTQYENPCGQVFTNADSIFTVAFRAPQVTVTKIRTNEPIDCGQLIEWTITVSNTSGYTLPIIWVEDTLDAAYTYDSSVGDPLYTSDNGTNTGQVVTWELRNVNHGDVVTLTLRATSDSSPCSPNLDNTVRAWWGCGAADGNSNSKPGTPADPGTCLSSVAVSTVRTETRQPSVGFLNIAVNPLSLNSCDDATELTVTISNPGPTDASNVDLVITLPAGLTYINGSSAVTCGGVLTDPAPDPTVIGNQLIFYNTSSKVSNLCDLIQAAGGNDTVILAFSVRSSCYVTTDLDFNLYYYDCCDDTQYNTPASQQITALYPALTVSKTPVNSQVDCSANQTWTITVTNNGTGNAEVIRVVDTLGNWLDYAGSFTEDQPGTITPSLIGGNPQVVGWEFNDLGPGATATFTFETTLNPDGLPNQADCTAALRQNNVIAQWACGTTGDAVDDNPNTFTYDCTHSPGSSAPVTTLQMPDLHITAITPGIACTTGDGVFSASLSVTVQNQGTTPTLTGFTVSVTDGTWTGTGSTGVLAAGASVTVTIATSGWAINCHGCTPYTLDAIVDSTTAVCECNEANNTSTLSYTPPLPDLKVNSITPTCTADGRLRVRVNISNVGCANSTALFVLHLVDDQGHSANINVNSLNAGASTNIDFTNWVSSCSPATINFTATVDSTNTNCECAADNSLTYTYNNTLPNLAISTITPSTSCANDGSISGTISVQVSNAGNGPVTSDFRITVTDGQGWTVTPWYNATLGGTLPLVAGGNATVTIPWTRGFTTAPYTCSFPTITVTLDTTSVICECSNASNAVTSSYNMTYPNLRITSVTPVCTSDGTYSVAVVVNNNGCDTATNAVVRLSDNDGQTADQTVTLAAGASQTLTYAPWPADGSPAALIFTASIDPAAAICELSSADNSADNTFNRPNLNLVSISPSCTADDTFQVSLVIGNNGSSAISNDFIVRLADNDGHSVDQNFTAIGGTLPLNNGTQQTVVFSNWTVDCNPTTINFSGALDPTNQVCESNSGDNTNTGTITVFDLQAVSVTAAAVCSSDGTITGTMAVTVANTGGNAINSDFRILVNDGQGWTSELWYQADLGGTLPLAVGVNDTVTFNWTRSFPATPYVCSFPAITVTVDSQGDICECTHSNNTHSGTYNLVFPDLTITAVANTIICLSDGSLTGTTVSVANNGCAAANSVVVRLISDCGLNFSDQTVDLAAGENRDVFFAFSTGITGCTCNFSASIDPDNAICELDGGNNTNASILPLAIPDIEVGGENLNVACSNDGSITVGGTVSLVNNGCGPALTDAIGMRFTLYSESDCHGKVLDQWTQIFSGVNIDAAGGSQSFSVQAHEIIGNICSLTPGCRLSVRIEADYDQRICEWDGTDNAHCANLDLACLDLAFSDVFWQCDPAGAITWNLLVSNSGNSVADNVLIRIYDNVPSLIYEQRVSIAAGATVTLTFTSAAYPVARDHEFRLVIDENNEICECDGQNNLRLVTVNCPFTGEPRLEIKKTCPPAQQPGGIFRFEIEVRNSGEGSIDDVEIEDVLPAPLQYVSGSSALDGKAIADPSGTTVLTWKIGNMASGSSHILVYSLIAPADADPGRYCNQAQAWGTALDGRRSESEKTTCCIILRREAGGCCLIIDERPMGFVQYPELAMAYIEPYFHTEKAMFASYAALHLWENIGFEKGSLPDFVRERLKNYALSNVEELYFRSGLGLTLPNGSLWLSYAGDYPQKETGRWKEKNTIRSMTPAQVAFELLALNKAAAREEKAKSKDMLNDLITKKLEFMAPHVPSLPKSWKFADGRAVRQKEKADLYDLASLYFSLTELGKAGWKEAAMLGPQLRRELTSLDNEKFDNLNLREEFLFILALKENGEAERAAKKISAFEQLFRDGKCTPANLPAYAMAVYADFKAGGTISKTLFAEMKSKFYSGDIGLFAEPQADFKQKIDLESLAPLILAFESQMPAEKDLFATTLYRTIEETGLFLKKTNLQVQRPPLNLIKNYPFTQEMLPLLTFIKSYDDMAPVFSETAMVQSPHTAPATENLLPVTYSKVYATQYETDTAQIGLLSFSLQQLGKDLNASTERVLREQGRSLDHSGKKYVRLLLASHAGLDWQGDVFLSTAKLAVKGANPTDMNLEPLDSKNVFSTDVLANKLVAEKIFLENPGQNRIRLETVKKMQNKLVSQFKTVGFIPTTFTAFKKNEAGELVVLPDREKADKMTVAKLQYALPDISWQQILDKETTVLKAQDMLFLSLAPQKLQLFFEKELRQFLSVRADDFAEIAAQVLARKILGLDTVKALKKLADIWDHETDLPLSSRMETMNRGQVYHYEPWQVLIYLMATKDNADFQFKRTLDYFTYLLESEWGMNWSEDYDALPAAEYWLVKESPREYPEPGDLLNFNVRVENRCPNGLASAGDLPSLFIKADFTPSLVFAGTELPPDLNLFKPFSWGYQNLEKDSYLQYTYQVLIPREFTENCLQGNIWVRGYTGYQPFGPDSASGEYCENFAQTKRLQLLPQDLIPGLVFADLNLNGRKDTGETGIAAIRFKDNRGRIFRSNAEGRFTVPAGQENVAVQIDFRSIPEDLVLISPPTQLTNRTQRRELTYALVPCRRLQGFVYQDSNQNGFHDEGEPRLAGIMLKAGDKECSSGINGEFIMNNLPDLWRELLEVDKNQNLYSGSLALVKIHITSKEPKL